MKKIFATFLILFSVFAFSQNNLSVEVEDDVYRVLENCQSRGLCPFLFGSKPYTQKKILQALEAILENEDKLTETEKSIINYYIKEYTPKTGNEKAPMFFRLQNKSTKVPLSFQLGFAVEVAASGGVYNDSDFNSIGFDIMPQLDFAGDITKYVSYRFNATFDITRMPLYEAGNDYFIGYNWFDDFVSPGGTENAGKTYDVGDYADAIADDDEFVAKRKYGEPKRRVIRTKRNMSYLPFSYKKRWGGQVYFLENLNASGLEGWPDVLSFTGAVKYDLRSSFLNNKINVGIGRVNREWAAMDNGSSLVLSSKAQPFFALDMSFEILSWLKFSALTGILEYPNQDYIAESSWPHGTTDDSLFQNAFSINMIELDFKYLHFDVGSSVVWPKRFELGYMFPLTNYTEYQNHIGDNDNCAYFADIKLRKENIGSIWASLYLDEINGINNNPLTSARAMFAGQLGTKIIIPKLPFTSVSFRYTKIEPFCYTHHSINYAPWYDHYICENYTNNGESLGYYLPPNSDEFFLRFDTMPISGLSTFFQYQFIRHGADYGSQQVQGSSLYSELSKFDRDLIEKHFLHDGAYNWMHIISVGASYTNKKHKLPFSVYANLGFVYSYYTMIDDENYEMTVLGNQKADGNTKYYVVDNSEYPIQCGMVLTMGVKLWRF